MLPKRTVLLMTRPAEASQRFHDLLSEATQQRLTLCVAPLIDIRATERTLDWGDTDGIVFSSAHAVAIASQLSPRRDKPCYCVGAATTAAAIAAGWAARQMGQDADSLIAALSGAGLTGQLRHLSGAHTRGGIAEKLTVAGLRTDRQVIYDQVLLPLSMTAQAHLAGDIPVIAPLFSPRTARHFARIATPRAPLWLAAFSPSVAQALSPLVARDIETAAHPTTAAMSATVELLLNRASRVEAGQGAD